MRRALCVLAFLLSGPAVPQSIEVVGGGGSGTVTGPGAACDDNDVARWDGATTSVLQCSASTLSDAGLLTTADVVGSTSICASGAAAAANSVCATANTVTAEGATADGFETILAFGDATADQTITCTGAASSFGCVVASPPVPADGATAGNALAFTASPAVPNAGAGADGAAPGGSITFTAGSAARDTSGNADAGDFIFSGGTGVGTGLDSTVQVPNGNTTTNPGLHGADADTGVNFQAGELHFVANGTDSLRLRNGDANFNGTIGLGAISPDVGLRRLAAGVVVPSNGSTGSGWMQQPLARAMLAADFTNATTTFNNTALSIPGVTNGRKYTFSAQLYVSNSVAADGAKLDFNGGTATATNFVATCVLNNAVGATLTQANATTAALATVINIAALTNTAVHLYDCSGSLEPSASGTFIIRAALNAATTGTLTVKRGSHLWVEDVP